MSVYIIGNIIGRALFAYLFVWLVCFAVSKFNYKNATNKAHSRWGVVSVATLFALPFLAQMGASV